MLNVVQSVNGANVVLDENVLATEVGQPMFFRYGQLLNLSIRFFPILMIVGFIGFLFGFIFSVISKSDMNYKKSLKNK